MAEINLSKYGITGTTEIVYNPSYEMLFEEETKPDLEGFEKGQETELGAVNVMTGIYTVYHKRTGVSKNYQCRREMQTERKVGSQRSVSIKNRAVICWRSPALS